MAREARRAVAILDADVVGHARETITAESDWTAQLAQHRVERLEPAVARHGGRVIGLTGKGVRAEFPSAAQALGAAIEFQQAVANANRERADDGAIVFHLGLHLAEAGACNASNGRRIERPPHRAATGGIVVSAPLRDALAGQVKASFAELGSAGLGTVERPVHTYEVGWDPADWPSASAAAAQPITKDGAKRTSLWPAMLIAGLVAVGVFHLADRPPPPPVVASAPQLTPEERLRLQERAAAAFALWQEGRASEDVEPDEPADPDARADNAAPSGDHDGFYVGALTTRAGGHVVTVAVRVSQGVGVGTDSRLDCGTAPLSLRISASGDVSGMMMVFGSTCLKTELAIRGRAVAGTLQLRLGSQYVELARRD
jgi:class 3 adenylate cyclase